MSVSRERKQKVLADAGFCCHYCADIAATVDHKTPSADGGTDDKENLVASCHQCNAAKGTIPYVTFFRFVAIFGRPEGTNWYRGTNFYIDRALANAARQVNIEKLVDIASERFSNGDIDDAVRLVRRGLRRAGIAIDQAVEDAFLCMRCPPAQATTVFAPLRVGF